MPTVIVDLDHTLLDTTRLKEALAKSLGLPVEAWAAAYEAFVQDNGTFKPDQFLEGVGAAERTAFDEVVKNTRKYLYKDSPQFLRNCQEAGWNMVLLTYGQVTWQQRKVDNLQLPDAITVVCTDQPKVVVIGQYLAEDGTTVFVNDRADEIDAIKQRYPEVQAYWVQRVNGKHTTPPQEDAILKADLSFKL